MTARKKKHYRAVELQGCLIRPFQKEIVGQTKRSWSNNVTFSSTNVTFAIAFPFFPSNIGGLQPQASHCNVSWMVARIWPGYIFFEKVVQILVEHPGLLVAVYYWLLSTIGCCLLLVAVSG